MKMILSRLKVFTQTYRTNYGNSVNIKLEKADECDAEQIISIRNQCFYDDYVQFGECPGFNIPLDKMKIRIQEGNLFKITIDNEITGDISVHILDSGVHWIGCAAVAKKYQNRGIGSFAIKEIEKKYRSARIWQLETPLSNIRNCRFYEKLGYKVIGEKKLTDKLTLGVFEKRKNT